MRHPQPNRSRRGFVRAALTVLVCAVLLGAAGTASWLIFESEPVAQREGATRKSAALVETVHAERGTYRPRLHVLGQVEPAREIELAARVAAPIIGVEASFVPGGIASAGAPLLHLDPADYEHTLLLRRAELRQIEAELAIEQGRQTVARQEYELLGEEIAPENRALVLREPQIESLRARAQAARAAVDRAQLDLDRTTITAPFDAYVIERYANLGSQITPSTPLARLVGIDTYWIVATVPLRDVQWLSFADEGGEDAARVRVRHTSAWPADTWRTGRLERLIGAVDMETRLARVLVALDDPLGRTPAHAGAPKLVLGTVLDVELEGRPLEDVVRIERDHLRKNDTVWVLREGQLEIRAVDVVFRDANHAYLSAGLDTGDEVVATDLATVTNGLALRRVDAAE